MYIWAMEQIESRRKFDENYQNVLVPWVVPADKNEKREEIVYNRYYRLFKKGELDELVINTDLGKIIKSDYNKDNWYVIAIKNYLNHF